jgi:hypothetical protein
MTSKMTPRLLRSHRLPAKFNSTHCFGGKWSGTLNSTHCFGGKWSGTLDSTDCFGGKWTEKSDGEDDTSSHAKAPTISFSSSSFPPSSLPPLIYLADDRQGGELDANRISYVSRDTYQECPFLGCIQPATQTTQHLHHYTHTSDDIALSLKLP